MRRIRAILALCLMPMTAGLWAQHVGIGTPSPEGKLHIKGSSDVSQLIIDGYTVQSNTSPLLRLRKNSGTDLLWVHSDTSVNAFVGLFAGRINNAVGGGIFNTFNGSHAGFSNTIGNSNSGFGANALFSNSIGSFNSAFGKNALFLNSTGSWNTAIGTNALFNNDSGNSNTALGNIALFSSTIGSSNTAIGTDAMKQNVDGNNNTANGYKALYNNISGSNNTAIGYESLNTVTSGNNNTALGHGANVAAADITNATAIGSNAYAGASNSVVIGSINGVNGATTNTNVGIGTSTPNAKLHLVGTLKLADGSQGAGKILTSDANGLASWQPPPPPPAEYYQTVWICCNPWMTRNLDVATYRNGDPIPKVTDNAEWASLTTGAYCYYDNDSTTYAAIYGKLYNWYAVNDSRGLAPEGWHIPTELEVNTLTSCLGGNTIAGGHMKEIGNSHWNSPNNGATNISGFKGLPGGYRNINSTFFGIGTWGEWWCTTEVNPTAARNFQLHNGWTSIDTFATAKQWGFSVRCIRD